MIKSESTCFMTRLDQIVDNGLRIFEREEGLTPSIHITILNKLQNEVLVPLQELNKKYSQKDKSQIEYYNKTVSVIRIVLEKLNATDLLKKYSF